MKFLRFAAAFGALIPTVVYAQNPQFTGCRSVEAAGNFVGPDEALVNGLVCKVTKPKTNSAVSQAPTGKDVEKSKALLGIIEPEILRSKDKESTNPPAHTRGASLKTSEPAAARATVKSMALLGVIEPEILRPKTKAEVNPTEEQGAPEASSGFQSSGPTASGALQPPTFEKIADGSLGAIARSYRLDAAKQVAAGVEGEVPQQKELSSEAERVAAKTDKAPVTALNVEAKRAGSPQVSARTTGSTAAVKPDITRPSAVPIVATPTAARQTAKNEVVEASPSKRVEVKPEAITATIAPPPAVAAIKSETNLPSALTTPANTPNAQDAVRTGSEPEPAASTTVEAPGPEPEPERVLNLGTFAAPKPAPETDPPPQPIAEDPAEESAFQEGQEANCGKNISLGSMENEKLFLAIPEWALKWYGKNQKRFPGICFSNSRMSGAKNFLVVFYTTLPHIARAESLKNISTMEDMTPVSKKGSFTTSYGGMWHYTYDRTVTTTITSVSAEKAPHNQETAILYATAYSEEGIPLSQHWPAANTKPARETSTKHRKNQDLPLQEFRVMAELLSRMVEDIAKL